MKRKYLSDEELIYKGRQNVILEFLADIKECYKLATKNIIKTKFFILLCIFSIDLILILLRNKNYHFIINCNNIIPFHQRKEN